MISEHQHLLQRAKALLSDPQPGLVSWCAGAQDLVRDIDARLRAMTAQHPRPSDNPYVDVEWFGGPMDGTQGKVPLAALRSGVPFRHEERGVRTEYVPACKATTSGEERWGYYVVRKKGRKGKA